ncbi:hypothetical protein Tco_1375478 [Tanacetum coccineum]
MAEQQTITYAPQWNNMTVDDVVFQTNNVVGNFNYPPNVLAYKPIMKFMLNCPLNKNCPSVVYQNFLREFWSTVVAFDPFSSTDEPEKCLLKEFLIKFLVLNGQRPLTLDFKTFCSTTGLDYNNGKYVAHPAPDVVLNENYSSTKQVNSIQQLLAFSLITGTEVDIEEIIYSDLGHETSGALSKKRKKPKSKKPPTETKVPPPNPMKGSEDTTSTTPNKGTTKTTPHPEGSLRDKDSGGNIPSADMEPIHTLVADPSGTGAKSDEEEVLATGDDMDEDPQDDAEVRTPSPGPTQPNPSHVQESTSDSSSPDLEKFDNTLPLTKRQLIKYLRKASIDQYYDENIAHRDQTNKLVKASMSFLDRSSTTISDLYKGLNVITELLKNINTAIKDDPATNQKINEATETFAKISSNITEMKSSTNMDWNLGSRIFGVELSHTALKQEISSLKKDTFEIKSMMTEMYGAFQVYLTEQEIQDYWDKKELIKKAEEEARLLEMTKPEVIKVVQEEAKKIGLDPKAIKGAKDGKIKHKYDSYMWTVSNRLKPEPINDIKIHPKTKPVVITVYRGTDGRNLKSMIPFSLVHLVSLNWMN